MPYAKAKDGTMLYYKDWGRGDPVVLLHGWPLSGDSFDDAAVRLVEAGHRAIIPDRRGFGRSDQPWDGHDYDTYADDVAAVLEDAGVNEPVSLVGFSMGGGEVARFLTKQGQRRVKKAVLISSVVPYMAQTDDNPNGVPQSTFDQMTEGMKKDRAHFFKGFFKDFFGSGLLSNPVSDEVEMNAWRQAMMAGLRPTLAAAQAFATTDFRPDLKSFTVPTLVIHGTSDQTVPIDATGRVVANEVPGAQLIEYDGSAHGVTETDKERLINDLLTFLGDGRGAQASGQDDQRSAIPLTLTERY
ncbi:alpha/beta hydrolase [Sphingomonas ginkgonis]|uniref:Alpha/beta hydrolase n=1 Tax=Sphingomonas ginkgonis TaxID=2315330 RepID=A0A3R9YKF6_9SPHN|nr:alpha/beta hydrolase [Sphingomonas ginkgonis]RST31865.1 alpha/beta hydrolase [Sphingomonas ginkgonis]